MIRRGDRELPVGMLVIADQRVVGAIVQIPLDIGVETDRPVVLRGRVCEVHRAQVVHDVPAAENEHALVPERVEASAEIEVIRRRLGEIDGELHHRHVGGWHDMG